MEEAEKLLKRMHVLFLRARALSTELASFIKAESVPLGEVVDDWLELAVNPLPRCSSSQLFINEQETKRLIEQRRAETWIKAEQKFAPKELDILTSWQALEAKALTLAVNVVLKNTLCITRECK